jgi:class 3 adenylate cyclase/tetratricopeptide (TPR) repeat protein
MTSVETVTVLITDLVGSTGLESRIGPGAADELRDEHFALLRGALEHNGGREVKNTGDGLIGAVDSASQAVSCAVAVQQRFERRNRKSEEQLLIKVGISLGDATASGGDYFGMPVIEAARLCERAQGGQILAKEIVAHLAGGRAEGSFKSVGSLELKGLPEPLTAVEVGWEPLGAEGPSLPLPPRLQEMPPGGFVGRTSERARLTELFDEAREGKRRLALISGEPGIGKTRLSTHTALEVRSQGAVVLYGRSDEELAIPYRPWIEALAHYIEHAPEQVLHAHIERHGGELTRMVPQLAERLPEAPPPRETDPETERYLLWGAVVGLLREASGGEPLVLVFDDLHWADKPTLQLLRHVTSQGQGMRALIIATYRQSDLARGHPLSDTLADLHREQGVDRIPLKGLDERNIAEIMERAAGHELDEATRGLAEELFRETDGNPFYTAELLRHLLESGGVYQQESGRWTVRGALSQLGIPESVREVLGRRVGRLGEEAREELSIAAVIGRDFDVNLLLRVSEHSEEELLGVLEEAVGASVLTESASVPGRFSFAHALINHTLYEDLGTTRRARLHRSIAVALEQSLGAEPGARVSELAHHWARATTAVDEDKAVTYARMAGERALQDLAPDEALRWFSQALELQGQEAQADPKDRCELLIGLGEAQRQTGEPAHRETLLEASRTALELEDAELAARAALANNRGIFNVIGEVDEERLRSVEWAIELDEPPHPARRARLLALQAQELGWDPDFARRCALADEAISLARGAGELRTLVEVLRGAFFAWWSAETLALRAALAREMSECAATVGDPALQLWAHNIEFQVFIEAGEFVRAEAALQHVRLIAAELGQPTLDWLATYHTAGWELLRGDLAAGERGAERAFEIGQKAGEPDAVFIYGAQFFGARVYQGRAQEVIEMLEQSAKTYPGVAAWRAGLATALCYLDRQDEARAMLTEAARDGFEHISPGAAKSTALALYADAAVQAGDSGAASILYRLIEPWGEQIVWSAAVGLGHARMWLGLLAAAIGNHEQADEHLAFACELQETNGLLLWAARAHLGWAEALVCRGAAQEAQRHAARALELSREHGYGAFEGRAAALLEGESATRA